MRQGLKLIKYSREETTHVSKTVKIHIILAIIIHELPCELIYSTKIKNNTLLIQVGESVAYNEKEQRKIKLILLIPDSPS